MWLSISPGMTARPPRSIRLVLGPASRPISSFVPTATMRSPRIATACAIVKRSSTVMIFPFDRIRSLARGLLRASIAPARHDGEPARRRPRQSARSHRSLPVLRRGQPSIGIRRPSPRPANRLLPVVQNDLHPRAAVASPACRSPPSSSASGMTLLTSGSSLTCPLSTSAIAAG